MVKIWSVFLITVKSEYADKLRYAGYTVLIEESFEINPPKQQEKLMSDISEVAETTPEETINSAYYHIQR